MKAVILIFSMAFLISGYAQDVTTIKVVSKKDRPSEVDGFGLENTVEDVNLSRGSLLGAIGLSNSFTPLHFLFSASSEYDLSPTETEHLYLVGVATGFENLLLTLDGALPNHSPYLEELSTFQFRTGVKRRWHFRKINTGMYRRVIQPKSAFLSLDLGIQTDGKKNSLTENHTSEFRRSYVYFTLGVSHPLLENLLIGADYSRKISTESYYNSYSSLALRVSCPLTCN